MRVFALSDVHTDHADNFHWLKQLSTQDFQGDALLLAGDVTHSLHRLRETLLVLLQRFRHVCFVPGNHEVWTLQSDAPDSLQKFEDVLALCRRMGVVTEPLKVGTERHVWLVPLFSWYAKTGDTALSMPKPGENTEEAVWSDDHFVKWPASMGAADAYFASRNQPVIRDYDAPIISFSHFLPRKDLVLSTPEEDANFGKIADPFPAFNFSRVAGSALIDEQVRELGSMIHVYGHQHRNRDRVVDGVRYVSHCLGYGRERELDAIHFIEGGPKLLWEG